MRKKQNQLTVVIRTNEERTIELIHQTVSDQVPAENIRVINEKPFFKAVQKTFEIGSQNDSPYLLALDGDILLFPEAVQYMIYEAGKYKRDDFFRIDFPIFDKFRGRATGVHFYNNRYARKFLDFLDTREHGTAFLRPEFENVEAFSKKYSLSYQNIPHFIVAKHDYFQYYRDIFNKYILRRKRGIRDNWFGKLVSIVKQKSLQNLDDLDYAIALEALLQDETELPAIEVLFEKYGIEEKRELPETAYPFIRETLAQNKIMSKLWRRE